MDTASRVVSLDRRTIVLYFFCVLQIVFHTWAKTLRLNGQITRSIPGGAVLRSRPPATIVTRNFGQSARAISYGVRSRRVASLATRIGMSR
jgi:hypothetical protein